MKIYKVKLDPSNPIEKLIKVPVGSDYGIQINWDYGKYPKFINTDIDTENGFLTNYASKWEENKSFHEIEGQKIFTDLPILTNIDEIVTFYYGKNETYDANKLDNFGSIKVVGVDSDDYDVDVGGGDATIEGISYENNELTLSAQTISLTGDVKINGEEYQSGSSFEYITEEEGKVVLSVNSDAELKFEYYSNNYPAFVSEKRIGIVSQCDAMLYSTNGTTRVTGQTGLALVAMNNNVDIAVPNGCVLINGTNISEIAGGSGGGSIEGLYNNETGYGIGSNSDDNIVIGNLKSDTSLSTINIGGNIISLRTTSSLINMQDHQIILGNNGCITLQGGNIELNGTVYINGEQYQGGGGSSVDYMYSVENEYNSSCIDLFIGNNNDGQVNYQVYINGEYITIGENKYYTPGNGWSHCDINTYLSLNAHTLNICIDRSNGGSWRINDYLIDLDRFLQEYGEYIG